MCKCQTGSTPREYLDVDSDTRWLLHSPLDESARQRVSLADLFEDHLRTLAPKTHRLMIRRWSDADTHTRPAISRAANDGHWRARCYTLICKLLVNLHAKCGKADRCRIAQMIHRRPTLFTESFSTKKRFLWNIFTAFCSGRIISRMILGIRFAWN